MTEILSKGYYLIFDAVDYIIRITSKIIGIVLQKCYDLITSFNELLFVFVFQSYILFKKNIILFVSNNNKKKWRRKFLTFIMIFSPIFVISLLLILGALVQNTQTFCKTLNNNKTR
jgi:hypothetical protein